MSDSADLRHGLAILRCFEEGPVALDPTDIARRTGLDFDVAEATLATLCAEEFLDREESGAYRLGEVFAILGQRMAQSAGLDRAEGQLAQLTARTGESASLSVRSGTHAIVLLLAASPQRLRVEHGVGSRLPLHASAMGKALLAFSDQDPERTVSELGDLERFTSCTVTTASALVAELRLTRDRGWAINREERYDGVVGVAAPVLVAGQGVVAAIGVQGPAARLRAPDEPALTRLVERTAQRVADCLASGAPRPSREPARAFNP